MSNAGAGPWSSGRAARRELFGVPRRSRVRVVAVRPVAGRHRVHPRRVYRHLVEQRLTGQGLVALRVARRQEPLVAPPQVQVRPVHRATRRGPGDRLQRRARDGAAGEHQRGHAAGGLDVHQPGDQARRDGGRELGRVTMDDHGRRSHELRLLATALRAATLPAVRSDTFAAALPVSAALLRVAFFTAVALALAVPFVAADFFAELFVAFLAVGLAAGLAAFLVGLPRGASGLAGRPGRVLPDQGAHRRPAVEVLLSGDHRQRVGVGLIGVQPAELLGQQLAELAPLERQLTVGDARPRQGREIAVRPVDPQLVASPEPDLHRGDAGPVGLGLPHPDAETSGQPAGQQRGAGVARGPT